jgi:hypothetical protein
MIPLQLFVTNLVLQTSLPNAAALLLPLVLLALLLDAVIIVVWYYLGVMLNNSGIKGGALSEFYQLIGTAILTAMIIGVLILVSTSFYSVMGSTTLMKPATISSLCTNIESTSQLNILGSSGSFLSGPTNGAGTGSLTGICTIVATQPDITSKLDYPLAATAVITANMTNQTAANLNYSYTVDAWLGFLSKLTPQAEYMRRCFTILHSSIFCNTKSISFPY